MDQGVRSTFCFQYCSPEYKTFRERSPFYFWIYQDDDDGEKYEAHRRYLNRMAIIASDYKCDCAK